MTDENRDQENLQGEVVPTSGATPAPTASAQQSSQPEQPGGAGGRGGAEQPNGAEEQYDGAGESEEEKEDEKSLPYNYNFASRAIGAGLIAFVATMIALIAFTTELDATAVVGALGALFTLIGTISGAYFGVKKSSDTEDKGRAAERTASARAQKANKTTIEAAGAMAPTEWEKVRERI